MSASSPPSGPALTTPERLMRLVPEQVGTWKRSMVRGAKAGPDGKKPATVEAEFRRGDVRASVSVSEITVAPPRAAGIDRSTAEGSEKVYTEGSATVRETVRRIDGRTDVALLRADRIAVTVHAIGVPAADLKEIALGIKPAAAH